MPDGVLINGKGPYQYNTTLVPGGIEYSTVTVDPGTIIIFLQGINLCFKFFSSSITHCEMKSSKLQENLRCHP